jgi:hypothetical protein
VQIGPDIDIASVVEGATVGGAAKRAGGHPSGIPAPSGGGGGGSGGGGGGGGWKGRAQKILLLKSKVRELREEVAALRERCGEAAGDDGASVTASVATRRTGATAMTSATRKVDVDAVVRHDLQVRRGAVCVSSHVARERV